VRAAARSTNAAMERRAEALLFTSLTEAAVQTGNALFLKYHIFGWIAAPQFSTFSTGSGVRQRSSGPLIPYPRQLSGLTCLYSRWFRFNRENSCGNNGRDDGTRTRNFCPNSTFAMEQGRHGRQRY
jgi:hypothetical protein